MRALCPLAELLGPAHSCRVFGVERLEAVIDVADVRQKVARADTAIGANHGVVPRRIAARDMWRATLRQGEKVGQDALE